MTVWKSGQVNRKSNKSSYWVAFFIGVNKMSEKTLMNVKVDVTGMEIFSRVLEILKFGYDNIENEEIKAKIYDDIQNLIGETHDISDFT